MTVQELIDDLRKLDALLPVYFDCIKCGHCVMPTTAMHAVILYDGKERTQCRTHATSNES